MYKLYHQILCPFSRKTRFFMAAKGIEPELVKENFWERRNEFIAMNPMGTIPVLFDGERGETICNSSVIIEYIEEKLSHSKSFIGSSIGIRAEARRIQDWFDHKFFPEVTRPILNERFYNRFLPECPSPNSRNIMIAKHNLEVHLAYMEFLLDNRKYLSGNELTIADMSAAGHISTLDYFGDITWRNHHTIKEWYGLIKSQKSFSKILQDKVQSITPPSFYNKLDF